MLVARRGHTATLLTNGKVLVIGGPGAPDGDLLASAELYDPVIGSWSAAGSLQLRRHDHTATLLPDGRVLVTGGIGAPFIGETPPAPLSTSEVYDPANATWTATGSMIEARSGHTATLLADGRVLVAGGTRASGVEGFGITQASAELYDPANATWTATASMADARSGHTTTLLPGGRVLVAGGHGGGDTPNRLSTAELYDPAIGTWTATGSMAHARLGHTTTLLLDNKVLVTGGYGGSVDGFVLLASAELYEPATGAWSSTESMSEPRVGHTATALPDGRLLVTGGFGDGGGSPALASAELYDPGSGTWTPGGSAIEARFAHTATLLADGRVLVAGGSGSQSEDLASAELYDHRRSSGS